MFMSKFLSIDDQAISPHTEGLRDILQRVLHQESVLASASPPGDAAASTVPLLLPPLVRSAREG